MLEFWLRQCHQDRPDKATELAGNGGHGDMPVLALIQLEELFGEPVLRFEGNGNDLRGLPLTTALEDQGRACFMVVVPGCLDQETSHVRIAGLGNGTSILPGSGGVF